MQQPATTYEIRVEGRLDQRWLEWFDAINIAYEENGETTLACAIRDQAALHGILNRVRDLGLALVSVKRVEPDSRTDATPL